MRHLPPDPKSITRRSFLRQAGNFFASHWLLTALPTGGAGLLGWAEHDTRSLELQSWNLYYPQLPPALEGKKIMQLSDLHLESLRIPVQKILAFIESSQPDIIVLTGDLISTRTDLDKLPAYLAPLSAKDGCYMVMGNNDYSHFSRSLFKRYLEVLRSLHWTPLLNEAKFLPELNLWIIGIDDPATAHDDVDKAYVGIHSASSNAFRLALAHSSDCLDDVAKYGADLLLTGHTHGGQIRLPGLKPFITNTYLGDHGIYEGYHIISNVPLYINRGIGESVFPWRFNVTPEITVFTLHRGNQPATQQRK